jgi:hypothetical protein
MSRRQVRMRPPSSSYQTQEANIGAVGNVTGSKEWQDSGKKDAQEGINEMKVSPVIFSLHRFWRIVWYGSRNCVKCFENRQRMQRRPQSRLPVDSVEGLRSWRGRRRGVRAWRRRVWRGKRRQTEMGDASDLSSMKLPLIWDGTRVCSLHSSV